MYGMEKLDVVRYGIWKWELGERGKKVKKWKIGIVGENEKGDFVEEEEVKRLVEEGKKVFWKVNINKWIGSRLEEEEEEEVLKLEKRKESNVKVMFKVNWKEMRGRYLKIENGVMSEKINLYEKEYKMYEKRLSEILMDSLNVVWIDKGEVEEIVKGIVIRKWNNKVYKNNVEVRIERIEMEDRRDERIKEEDELFNDVEERVING
jgi:hypothetical protein